MGESFEFLSAQRLLERRYSVIEAAITNFKIMSKVHVNFFKCEMEIEDPSIRLLKT